MDGTTPKSGAQVSLSLTVVPEDDGLLYSSHVGTLTPNGGATGADGRLRFYFIAPSAGGTHTITATCDGCSNQATGTIKVSGCPVKALTSPAELSRLEGETATQVQLTQDLEGGMNAYSLLSTATQQAEQCLAGRVGTVLGNAATSGYQVTSTVRTVAYQKHLREVWDKFWDLKRRVESDPAIQQVCQERITQVEGEMGFNLSQDPATGTCTAPGRRHCIRSLPAQANPKHTQNIAFDISLSAVNAYQNQLNLQTPPKTVQQEANACGLTWGGTFVPIDKVHFVLQ